MINHLNKEHLLISYIRKSCTNLFLCVCLLACCVGCDSGPSKPGEAALDCPPYKKASYAEIKIRNIKIYLDASGSMRGFMPQNSPSAFQEDVPYLLSRIEKEFSSASIDFLLFEDASSNSKTVDLNTAKNTLIPTGNISNWASTTYIPEMISSIALDNHPYEVSILITDGIYSPQRKPQTSQAERKVFEAVSRDMATAIFCVTADFRDRNISTPASPYYFIVLGDPFNIQKIRSLFELHYKKYQEVNFGFPETIPFYSILPYVENTGMAEPGECKSWAGAYLKMENVNTVKQPEMWVGFNLSQYPVYTHQQDYLKKNLSINGKGLIASRTGEVLTQSQFSSRVTDPTDKKLFEKCTHFIRIKISEVTDKTSEINISLKKSLPDWIESYSHNVADSADLKRDRTFGLDKIIAGMQEAYKGKEDYLFRDLKIVVTKN